VWQNDGPLSVIDATFTGCESGEVAALAIALIAQHGQRPTGVRCVQDGGALRVVAGVGDVSVTRATFDKCKAVGVCRARQHSSFLGHLAPL